MLKDIYLAKIYFSNYSAYKIRPVLIIKELGNDLICLQLTSQIKENKIIIKNSDLTKGFLRKDSLVVYPKNFTLHKSILHKYITTINQNLFNSIYEKFCITIGCCPTNH